MGRSNDWMQRISEHINHSMEPIPGVFLVELSGDERLLIENHKGIIHYSDEKVCIKVKLGVIIICGSRLELSEMTEDKIVIFGKIDSVTLSRGDEK